MPSDMLRRHFRAELHKVTSGRALTGLVVGGALWCALSGYTYYTEGVADPAALAAGTVPGDIVRSWMMMQLFSAIYCAMIVTRDSSGGTLGRTVLTYGGRGPVFLAKLLVALLVSAGFALVSVVGAAVNVLAAQGAHTGLQWTGDSVASLAGVAACSVLAGLFGLMAGWVIRNQTFTVLALVILIVGVEPGIQRLVPGVAKFLFSIALSAVYRDPKPELLPVAAAVVVSLGWIAALTVAARTLLSRRDVG